MTLRIFKVLVLSLALGACSDQASAPRVVETSVQNPAAPSAPVTPAAAPRNQKVVVCLGDSLTAGYALDVEQAFPYLVEQRLRQEGYAVEVRNAGISGDTTAGGLSRLDWLLRQQPDVLVVALGANDGLRGLSVATMEQNLREIIKRARAERVEVVLAGMALPPSYGADYADAFAAVYPRLAKEFDLPLIPFLLDGVAGFPELNLSDGIHPTAGGHQVIAETVRRGLLPVLASPSP
jgi:acyl-CoA thioesterase I